MMKQTVYSAALCAAIATLAGCGGSGGGGAASVPGPALLANIPVPGIGAGTNFAFDIGATSNLSPGRYFFTDRNNKSVDVVDIAGSTLLAQITGTGVSAFAGVGSSIPTSGPDGIQLVPGGTGGHGLLYVGDINKVMVIDIGTLAIVNTITGVGTAGSGKRADEDCFDPADNLLMIASPEDDIPTLTMINTTTQTIVSKITMIDPAGAPGQGVEQCRYDSATRSFFLNNDGTTANPDGEINQIPAASIVAIPAGATVNYTTLAGVKIWPLSTPASPCDPTGLALGPGNDIAVDCRPGAVGAPLVVKIFDKTAGSAVLTSTAQVGLLATVAAGGGDQMDYDPVSNRYAVAANRWNNTGLVINAGGGCSAAKPCNPVLSIIDGATRTLITRLPAGNNAHSVAIDPVTSRAFMPYSSATSPPGATIDPNFTNGGGSSTGGIAIYKLR